MATTPSYYVNSPVSGTKYLSPYQFIPNNATSVSVTVKAWSGADGTGSAVVRTLTAYDHNVTGNTDTNSSSGSGNNWSASSSSGANGTNVFCGAGEFSGSSIGSLEIIATYTGTAIGQVRINTGTPASPVWTLAQALVNTGTPASPVWTTVTNATINTGTPGSPTWTALT